MKITHFEQFVEKVVPWFIAVALAVTLWAATSCRSYPNQSNVIKPDKTKHAQFR